MRTCHERTKCGVVRHVGGERDICRKKPELIKQDKNNILVCATIVDYHPRYSCEHTYELYATDKCFKYNK